MGLLLLYREVCGDSEFRVSMVGVRMSGCVAVCKDAAMSVISSDILSNLLFTRLPCSRAAELLDALYNIERLEYSLVAHLGIWNFCLLFCW